MAGNGVRAALTALAALALSACLVSGDPLIAPEDADTPLRAGLYDQYELEPGAEPDFDGHMELVRRGDDYAILEDDEDDGSLMRLRRIGTALYAAQVWEMGDEGFMYLAVRPQDGGALFWFGDCEALGEADRERLGLVEDGGECAVGDFDTLAEALAVVVDASEPMLEWRPAP